MSRRTTFRYFPKYRPQKKAKEPPQIFASGPGSDLKGTGLVSEPVAKGFKIYDCCDELWWWVQDSLQFISADLDSKYLLSLEHFLPPPPIPASDGRIPPTKIIIINCWFQWRRLGVMSARGKNVKTNKSNGSVYVRIASGHSGFQVHVRTCLQIFKMSGFMPANAAREKFGCNGEDPTYPKNLPPMKENSLFALSASTVDEKVGEPPY
ncbi:hypothetical protein AVEN_274011-1 [Araneus ventricosus]|uniref:Uncharacterized protein n=1 Tax=Araneus ventricosus TaxID=182803 RepID=A0A4Y2S5K3_ARAVE|nr:hypothetical protein AVEN_274011-1 [Araneus ventricosus]